MLDLPSGRVPNYGANDGALVLPLSSCDYTDYRPTVQAARYQATGRLVLASGPWDETALWLFGGVAQPPSAVSFAPAINQCHTGKMPVPHDAESTGETPVPQEVATDVPVGRCRHGAATSATVGGRCGARRFDAGGYYTLRSGDTWCMIRCHTYRGRPAHVDMLHVDLWHKGVNVLGDSGSYRYHDPITPKLERYFKDIRAHNTIEIDDTGPLELASRFLWLPWPAARCLDFAPSRWRGESRAYDRPPWNVVHRRTVEPVENYAWRITDEIVGRGTQVVTLRWHLADGELHFAPQERRLTIRLPKLNCSLAIDGPDNLVVQVRRGLDAGGDVAGWRSDYYGSRQPRPTLVATARCALPQTFVTLVRLEEVNR
jgi:hypothetical protein